MAPISPVSRSTAPARTCLPMRATRPGSTNGSRASSTGGWNHRTAPPWARDASRPGASAAPTAPVHPRSATSTRQNLGCARCRRTHRSHRRPDGGTTGRQVPGDHRGRLHRPRHRQNARPARRPPRGRQGDAGQSGSPETTPGKLSTLTAVPLGPAERRSRPTTVGPSAIDGGQLPLFGGGREQHPGERLHRTAGSAVQPSGSCSLAERRGTRRPDPARRTSGGDAGRLGAIQASARAARRSGRVRPVVPVHPDQPGHRGHPPRSAVRRVAGAAGRVLYRPQSRRPAVADQYRSLRL